VACDGTPGGSAQCEVAGNAGEAFGVLLSNARGRLPFANRAILLNLGFLIPLTNGILGGTGLHSFAIPIPNDPNLLDVDFYMQGVLIRSALDT